MIDSKKSEGFTLIELLIVVSIIGVLAAVAIPQFSAYRLKGLNSAALSDLKNARTLQESLFSDSYTYGASEIATLNTVLGTGGTGTLITGPAPLGTLIISGSVLAGSNQPSGGAPVNVSIGIGISNGINFYSTTIPGPSSAAYVMCSKHIKGDRVFATESTASSIMYVQNNSAGTSFVNVPLSVGGAPATGVPAAASATIRSIQVTTPGGGSPNVNWSTL